jgi:hypothetical protein
MIKSRHHTVVRMNIFSNLLRFRNSHQRFAPVD